MTNDRTGFVLYVLMIEMVICPFLQKDANIVHCKTFTTNFYRYVKIHEEVSLKLTSC